MDCSPALKKILTHFKIPPENWRDFLVGGGILPLIDNRLILNWLEKNNKPIFRSLKGDNYDQKLSDLNLEIDYILDERNYVIKKLEKLTGKKLSTIASHVEEIGVIEYFNFEQICSELSISRFELVKKMESIILKEIQKILDS